MEGSQLSHSLAFAMNCRLLLPKHAYRCSRFQPHHSRLQDRSLANSEMKSGARNSKSDRNKFLPTFLHVIPPPFLVFSSSFSFASYILFFYLYFLFLPQFLFFNFFSSLLLTSTCTVFTFHLTTSNHCKIAINI